MVLNLLLIQTLLATPASSLKVTAAIIPLYGRQIKLVFNPGVGSQRSHHSGPGGEPLSVWLPQAESLQWQSRAPWGQALRLGDQEEEQDGKTPEPSWGCPLRWAVSSAPYRHVSLKAGSPTSPVGTGSGKVCCLLTTQGWTTFFPHLAAFSHQLCPFV